VSTRLASGATAATDWTSELVDCTGLWIERSAAAGAALRLSWDRPSQQRGAPMPFFAAQQSMCGTCAMAHDARAAHGPATTVASASAVLSNRLAKRRIMPWLR